MGGRSAADAAEAAEAAAMAAVRDGLLDVTRQHEAGCPGGGQPCWTNRAVCIAYLCHALGLRGGETWARIRAFAEGYDRRCPNAHGDGRVCRD